MANVNRNQTNNTTNEKDIWYDLKTKQEEIQKLKEDFNMQLLQQQDQYKDHLKKMNIVLLSISQQTKYQNESVERCYTTINEVLPIMSSAFEIIQRIITKMKDPNQSNKNDDDTQEILYHVSQSLDFIKDRNELLVNNQKALNHLVEQQGKLMMQGIDSLISSND